MRNKIITVILLISAILLAFTMIRGIDLNNFKVLSISQIKEKNNELTGRINKANELAKIEYPNNVEKLTKTFEQYTLTKEKYEQLSGISSKEKIDIYETKQYDISYLWKLLGDYAEQRNLVLGIDIKKTNTANNLYSFNFSLAGEYRDIIRYIEDLENDSDLYFRIYDFKISGAGTKLNATFRVENININPSTLKGSQINTDKLFK